MIRYVFNRHGFSRGVHAGQGSNHARGHRHVGRLPSCCSRSLAECQDRGFSLRSNSKPTWRSRQCGARSPGKSSNALALVSKRAHKLFDKRAKDLNRHQQYCDCLLVGQHLPLLAACIRSQERLYAIYEVKTALRKPAVHLHWEVRSPVKPPNRFGWSKRLSATGDHRPGVTSTTSG